MRVAARSAEGLPAAPTLVWKGELDDISPTECRWRRLLTSLAVFHDHLPTWPERKRRMRAVWPEHVLNRPGIVMLSSALLELETLGVIELIDQVQDGFLVRLTAREEKSA